jgi:perosamine synthetase
MNKLDSRPGLLTGRAAAALWAVLRAWGIVYQAVLIPANTCYMVLWAVLHSGNRPILVDVDPGTGLITPETLDQCLAAHPGLHPAVLIPAHLYGLHAPMQTIMQWAHRHQARVIEDAAQAISGTIDGQPVGSWGDAALFSFGSGKIVDQGVGGMLVSADEALLAAAETLLRNLPVWDERLRVRTNEWQALYWALHQHEDNPALAALYPQLYAHYPDLIAYRFPSDSILDLKLLLNNLPRNLEHRHQLAAHYDQWLAGLPVHLPPRSSAVTPWKYPLLTGQRYALLEDLWAADHTRVTRWYPSLQVMTRWLSPMPQAPTPTADTWGAHILNLPLDLETTLEEVDTLCSLIRRFFRNHALGAGG